MSLLSVRGVSITLGITQVLAEVRFAVTAGEVVGLIGPNGAGKTTLLRAMAGLLPLDSGEIRFDARPLRDIERKELARKLAYLPQGGESHWAVTVETLVMMGRLPHMGPWRSASEVDRAAVARALEACDVGQFVSRPVTNLSGGERARVLLARALAVEPMVLLADEPVAGLDPAHQLDVMQRLCDLAVSGAGIVVVMHDLTLASRFCHRLALLHRKRIAAEGSPGTVLSPENLARCYGIRAHYGSVNGHSFVVPVERVTSGAKHAAT